MTWRGFRGAELAFWAIWLGALWFMAILVAPGLFKWLPRPEAGLVAGRLFYMLALYSLGEQRCVVNLVKFCWRIARKFAAECLDGRYFGGQRG